MMEEMLKEVGLSQNESRIYLTLLKMGSSTATQIIKKTGIHRANVYDILEKLYEKGLISSVTKINVKHYQASNPRKLLGLLKEKEQKIQDILPQLESDFNSSESKEEVQVFKGKKGLKTAIEDILKENKTWYVFGGAGKLTQNLEFYLPHWQKQRKKQKLVIKIIYDNSLRGKKKAPYTHIKYLESKINFPVAIGIYGNKVMQVIFGEEPMIILIKSEKASIGFMEYFNLLWKIAKP